MAGTYIDEIIDANGDHNPLQDTIAQNGIIANTQLLKDTVGWTNKNKYDTVHGQQDVVINAQGEEASNNGTYTTPYIPVTKNQIISYTSKTGSPVYRIAFYNSSKTFLSRPYYSDNNKLIELPANTAYIRLAVDNQHVEGVEAYFTDLMCRDYDILDSTYEPYRGTTAFPRDEEIKLGARQLITPKFMPVDANTTHGITYTDNDDGTININGTASERSYYNFHAREGHNNASLDTDPIYLDAGDYIYSKEDTQVEAQIFVLESGAGVVIARIESNQTEAGFTLTERTRIGTQVSVASGVTINNLTFKPTIRIATDPNPNWSPYAMTNRELTEAVNNLFASNTKSQFFSTYTNTHSGDIYVKNGMAMLRVRGNSNVSTSGDWVTLATLKPEYRPPLMTGSMMYGLCVDGDSGAPFGWAQIDDSGNVKVFQSTGSAKTPFVQFVYIL